MSTISVARSGSYRRRSSALTSALQKRETRKIIVAGSTRCGKTALVQRFLNDYFPEEYKPTVEDCYNRDHKFKDYILNIEIVDMCGPFMFPVMRDLNIQSASVAMLLYEIDNKSSMQEAADILLKIKEVREDQKPLPVVLVGTKLDLIRSDDGTEVYEFSNERFSMMHDMDRNHVLTSAKDNIKVAEAFNLALEHILSCHAWNKEINKHKARPKIDKSKGCAVN